MAKAIGVNRNLIAALSQAIFAICIELGSGVGSWLVFGHGRREDDGTRKVVPTGRTTAPELVVM